MVEFAVALIAKLDIINKHSFNNFKLRVGESTLAVLIKKVHSSLSTQCP